jgi:hypothetical protein
MDVIKMASPIHQSSITRHFFTKTSLDFDPGDGSRPNPFPDNGPHV